MRPACTVPHTVPVSFREAHVGRCPGDLPGLPGGSGNGSPILAHSGGQVTLQLSARQPGQPKVLVSFQGFSDLLGGRRTLGRTRRLLPLEVVS